MFYFRALSICVTAGMLAGCGGSAAAPSTAALNAGYVGRKLFVNGGR